MPEIDLDKLSTNAKWLAITLAAVVEPDPFDQSLFQDHHIVDWEVSINGCKLQSIEKFLERMMEAFAYALRVEAAEMLERYGMDVSNGFQAGFNAAQKIALTKLGIYVAEDEDGNR